MPLPPFPSRRCGAAILLAIGLFLTTACGKKDNYALVPVAGKVIVGKVPLPKGQVTFWPDASKGNTHKKTPTGTVQADGSYKLSIGTSEGIMEGAPPGWYKVTISQGPATSGDQAKMKMPVYDPNLSSEKNTTLNVEVKEGAPAGAYDLKLISLGTSTPKKK